MPDDDAVPVPDLKPCPFCGRTPLDCIHLRSVAWAVCCPDCGTDGPVRLSLEVAVKAWNRRAYETTPESDS